MSDEEHVVVRNDEGSYSVWATRKGAPPSGWHEVGVRGSRSACLAHIEAAWTELRRSGAPDA